MLTVGAHCERPARSQEDDCSCLRAEAAAHGTSEVHSR